ncbi:MAG: hypothetical protein V4795_01725 [Pseudomonadota bacterium]
MATWLAAASPTAVAQARVSTPAPVASASAGAQPGPQRLSPEALRDSATAPGSLRPERPALPQVSVPVGLPPPAPTASSPGALPPNPAASAGGISNAVARCEAKTSALEREQCRRRLERQSAPAR